MYRASKNKFYNEDCISGAQKRLADNAVDLIITDPPYGIEGDTLDKHYNRDEGFVVDGYVEVPQSEYAGFSEKWVVEAERILRPGGSIYIVSGYTNLGDILNALKKTSLQEVNHIIWKYNFGVYTRKKYVSSHYHILFYEKPGGKRVFNTHSRYGMTEKDKSNKSLNYKDREDVWIINREYKPGQEKNKNELPLELLIKMIQYSSNEGDTVCDLFLGGFSTARVAIGLKRYAIGFELNKNAFDAALPRTKKVTPGDLLERVRKPKGDVVENYGKPWTKEEMILCYERYKQIYSVQGNKKRSVEIVALEMGRGFFSILNIVEKIKNKEYAPQEQTIFNQI